MGCIRSLQAANTLYVLDRTHLVKSIEFSQACLCIISYLSGWTRLIAASAPHWQREEYELVEWLCLNGGGGGGGGLWWI